nr:hypothetical protein GCM10020092_066050 [Actinoplanes digitatis]
MVRASATEVAEVVVAVSVSAEVRLNTQRLVAPAYWRANALPRVPSCASTVRLPVVPVGTLTQAITVKPSSTGSTGSVVVAYWLVPLKFR